MFASAMAKNAVFTHICLIHFFISNLNNVKLYAVKEKKKSVVFTKGCQIYPREEKKERKKMVDFD